MSENDPVCYQKFINRQMESFHKTISPPIIRFVVKLTQKVSEGNEIYCLLIFEVILKPKRID